MVTLHHLPVCIVGEFTDCVCVYVGGMPAPDQSPVMEEGLLLNIRDTSTGRRMEKDTTANNILASVKEQVQF